MGALRTLIEPAAWHTALEKFGAATGLTIGVYDSPSRRVLGPVHATPLFEAIHRDGREPALFRSAPASVSRRRTRPSSWTTTAWPSSGARSGEAMTWSGPWSPATASRRFRRSRPSGALPDVTICRCTPCGPPSDAKRHCVGHDSASTRTCSRRSPTRSCGRAIRAQEAAQAAARLAEGNAAKDQFLAMLAHELRNPLAPIRIAAQLVGHSAASPSDIETAREILNRQVAHLARLLDDLLDVSRITRGKIELRKESVDLAIVVATALEASRPLIEEHGHQLAVSVPQDPVTLEADPVRLAQVVTNLVNNAAKYTPPHGHIRVVAAQEGRQVVLRVRDNGSGMPPELVPRVFDLFIQGDRSLAHAAGGLGIGLTVVRTLVELHGGTVSASSEGPGRGSEFVVRVPIGEARAARRGVPAPRRSLCLGSMCLSSRTTRTCECSSGPC